MGPFPAIAFSGLLMAIVHAIPAQPHYFSNRVDHFGASVETFEQRYYINDTVFGGPGYPFLVILGGEGAIPPEEGFFYPFIVDTLAPYFKALVLEPEHRFYGISTPEKVSLDLLTPMQALADFGAIIQSMRKKYNCTGKDNTARCPVVTIGGSYPGFLSAMMRLRYPDVVDIGYAASAPVLFYAQKVGQFDYYKKVTESAEEAFSGCPAAVRSILAQTIVSADKEEISEKLQLCQPLPKYLQYGSTLDLSQALAMIVMYSFANLNMANYPPPDTGLQRACVSLTKSKDTPWEALREFLKGYSVKSKNLLPDANCYNLSSQIPAGPNGTISGGDWSGVGTGQSGQSWDFETCTFLIEHIGTNNVTDMFPPRNFTLEWLNDHCASRFGPDLGVPRPGELANLWGFDRLLEVGASNIIFTNGLKDGWSVGGIQSNLSDTLIAINIKDGAHHSDLSHTISGPNTTDAVKLARVKVTRILKEWLDSIPRY